MNSYTIPLPRGLKFTEWGALVAEQLAAFGVAAPHSDNDWKPWVCALFYVPDIVSRGLHTPDEYPTWQLWAERFVEIMG